MVRDKYRSYPVSLAKIETSTASDTLRLDRRRNFVISLGQLVDRAPSESALLGEGAELLSALVRVDDWLPDRYAEPAADRLPPVPSVRRSCRTVFGRELCLGTRPDHAHSRPHGLG